MNAEIGSYITGAVAVTIAAMTTLAQRRQAALQAKSAETTVIMDGFVRLIEAQQADITHLTEKVTIQQATIERLEAKINKTLLAERECKRRLAALEAQLKP